MPSKAGDDEEKSKSARKRIAGRRRISPEDLKRIVKIVSHWPNLPITWELICARVARDLQETTGEDGKVKRSGLESWSRQALSSRVPIKKAYQARKVELEDEAGRKKKRPARSKDPEIVMLRREIETLRIEKKALEEQLAEYEERLVTMTYNRTLSAKTETDVVKQLKPKTDRQGRENL